MDRPAYLWRPDGLPADARIRADAISRPWVAGTVESDTAPTATIARWNLQTGAVDTLDPQGSLSVKINGRGWITWTTDYATKAWLLADGKTVELPLPGGDYRYTVSSVNADGTLIGGSAIPGDRQEIVPLSWCAADLMRT
ncbi:hypothetical protein [Herbihabitans rhizosphaerae]|uniref:hypothetical protein n=1 Tax=Herbihabitans rhizosphaerae TaxID=1872711 RepID=UPI00102D0E64|nr:hypothetical protein [Herbihabitans rhizosphaerae]